MSQKREEVHGFLEAVEAPSGGLAIQSIGFRCRRLGDKRLAQQRFDPTGQGVLERLAVQGDQHLADPSGLGGPARETESVNQRDLLVLSPLTDSRVTLRAAHDGATH